ncbi:hypothetical protein [Devosia beringensis]|uniref:hypothetical protein n=1 Tax=Devosia beringensis TaxID=2657486 RepID=UPI00186B5C14|nr:hypothetical protein [Devosia beringensis]
MPLFRRQEYHYNSSMTLSLRSILPLLVTLGCLFLALAQPARADGRADWQGYSWQKFGIAKCLSTGAALICPAYHQKWDWKRNQWVDIAISIDGATGRLDLSQQLTNRDPHDDDDVCVTMLILDQAGRTILAHHQNWHSRHRTVMQDNFVLRSPNLAAAASVHIGSKQCRQGSHQDDAVYAAVLVGIVP